MAITNYERVGKTLEILKNGLGPFVEREFSNQFKENAAIEAMRFLGEDRILAQKPPAEWDASALLRVMFDSWNEVFRKTLGYSERSMVSELRDSRNKWAHQQTFSSDDTYRVMDSASRLLSAVSAPEAQEVEKMKMELLRLRFDEQVRNEKRKSSGTIIESQAASNLKNWREVVTPHKDVASGRYQQAEFAADLWQVHNGEGSDEYRNPVEFFRRTYLTESLKLLLVGAVKRLGSDSGGDPVVQLQTNFGGGKTHSMLALYHLFSGVLPAELAGIDSILAEAGVSELPKVKRAVFVGNKVSPGNPVTKPDGTVIRTIWGEIAWQLGGRDAFERIRLDDEKATSPGDMLRELFNDYGPCLVLIDEWVAYARQLHDESNLPAGGFETQFSFAQVLTESAKLAKNCLLVVSLPASDGAGSPQNQADDAEVGGQRGREALDRLGNVIGRVESSWRPASAEEGFEIVRRRLFEPLISQDQFKARDLVARQFYDFYRSEKQEFPPECSESDYEKRLKAAYPVHPEVFDRLYSDWSTLVKFQRTRGVLRLMAAVIHSLWEKGDRNPLILPSSIPIDDQRVQFELTRYLPENWVPVIEKDVDGPNSLPLRIDGEVPNLGKYSACRRVARTIYLGSAPTPSAANRGLEDRRIKLGCVMPGESPSVFGDALRRLSGAATYLYPDGNRYWYSTQPTVTKLADDRAEQLKRDPDRVVQELENRLKADLSKKGDFSKIHPMPRSNSDVVDEMEARLVVLGPESPYSKEPDCPALKLADSILESRGNTPRKYRNSIVFLAAEKTRLQDLDEAVRKYLAWESILLEKDRLDLTPNQVKQAEDQKKAADGMVMARIPETYQCLIVPFQSSPQSGIELKYFKLGGQEPLAARASKKLKTEELLLTSYGASNLRVEIDKIPLWRENNKSHVSIKQLVEDFASYPYLPRLRDSNVLVKSISDGIAHITWAIDTFAYAENWDEETGRYRGLVAKQNKTIADVFTQGLLVKPDVAKKQMAEDAAAVAADNTGNSETQGLPGGSSESPTNPHNSGEGNPSVETQPEARKLKRFHGSVELDSTRMGRDAGKIAEEIVANLLLLKGAKVKVTLEIEAEFPDGAPDNVVRTVTENSRALKFDNHEFEAE